MSEFGYAGSEFREFLEIAAGEKRVEEGVEGLDGWRAAEGGDGEEGADGTCGEAGAAIEGDDMAEEGLGDGEAGLVLELVEELFHVGEHLGAAELGDDEVVGEEGVAEGFVDLGVGVEEEFKSEGGVLLGAEEGGEPEGRYWWLRSGHCEAKFSLV